MDLTWYTGAAIARWLVVLPADAEAEAVVTGV